MEFFIIIFALSAFLLFVRDKLFAKRKSKSRPDPALAPLKPLNLPLKERRAPVQVFDSKTAAPPHENRVLTGAAYVVDGDTITIKKTQIRLFGVDAPELNHPFGQKAKWAIVKLCKGQIVRAEITDEDAYGRTVARCYLPDGRDLSAELVKQGLALDWAKYSGGAYRKLETVDARKTLWLADARQKGRMHVWEKFEAGQAKR